jgi:putative flippase GtrA
VTAAALAGLSLVIDPRLAYTAVFAAGIVLAAVMADRFVYGVRLTRSDLAAYAAVYVGAYLIGLAAVQGLRSLGLPAWTSAGVVVVTAPLTFAGGLVIARRRSRRAVEEAAG